MDNLASGRLTSPADIPINVRGQLTSPFETISKTQYQQQEKLQEKQQQEQLAAPKYTTVGSVYNPQASQPLQPPARRGRTIKWPPTPHSESPHLGFSQATLSALPYRNSNSHLPQTSPTTLGSFQHYSPLRQNFDRAASPPSTNPATFHISSHNKDILMQAHPTISIPQKPSMALPNMLRGGSPCANVAVGRGKLDDANTHSDDEEEDDDDDDDDDGDDADFGEKEYLRRMSVKSLTNLASYLNPMQKPAQKLLSRTRPLPIPANSYTQAGQSSSYRQPSDVMGEERFLPFGSVRHTRSDPVATCDLLQSDRADENGGLNRPLRIPPGFYGPSQKGINVQGFQAAREPTSDAILSKGFGAPQPLTAGPPGQRQYRASALESTVNAMQGGFRRNCDEQPLMPNPYTAQMQRRQPPYSIDDLGPSFDSEDLSSIRAMLNLGESNDKRNAKSRVMDSMSAEDARKWYPHGLPPNFNHDTVPVPRDWTDYPLDRMRERRRVENLTTHMAKTLDHFYSGTDMFSKTIAEATEEKKDQHFRERLGVIGGERKKYRRNPNMSIEDAIRIPAHEHCGPLLSMAFQTFVNYNEISPNGTIQKNNG